LGGVGALWDCVPRVCGGGGGCAGGGAPLGAVLVLSWCGEVPLGDKQSSPPRTHLEDALRYRASRQRPVSPISPSVRSALETLAARGLVGWQRWTHPEHALRYRATLRASRQRPVSPPVRSPLETLAARGRQRAPWRDWQMPRRERWRP